MDSLTYDFCNKCDFVFALRKVKEAMAKMEGLADDELWNLLDEAVCKLKQEIERK